MVVKWLFEDLVTVDSYELEINPNTMKLPAREKKMNYQTTAAPDGKVIAYEGRDAVQVLGFSGVTLSEEQHNAFVEWFEKRHQIRITDDRGDQWIVYITKYTPTRRRAVHYPYKHEYEIEAFVLDWPD